MDNEKLYRKYLYYPRISRYMYLGHYLEELGYPNIPYFLIKYLQTPSLLRLKKVGYFCGMDYASKNIYNFRESISRYDHSVTVGLIVYKLTKDKVSTIAGLFHDIATPCFSHVIDYMNEDYLKQESTEEYTEDILKNDEYLQKCLKEDNISIYDIINFKKFSVVDNDRPKLCADRIDGVILTGIGWTKNINIDDITKIVEDMRIYTNEYNEQEIGFESIDIAKKVLKINESINTYCHSKEDNYMMQLLADITKLAINKEYIKYKELYYYSEEELFNIFKSKNDSELDSLISNFENIKKEDIPETELPEIKVRNLNPIVNGIRLKSYKI